MSTNGEEEQDLISNVVTQDISLIEDLEGEITISHDSNVHSLMRPRIFASEVVLKGFIEVQKDTLLLPPNYTQHYDYYKLVNNVKSAVFVIAITKDNQFLINKEYRHPTNLDFLFGLPGGIIDQGETPEQAAQRELLEETGYHTDLSNIRRVGSSYPLPAISGLQMFFVVADQVEKKQEPQLEPSENLQIELVSEERIEEILSAQLVVEEVIKQHEEPPAALNVDGNFVTAWCYYKMYKERRRIIS